MQYSKSTIFQANHNYISTAKIRKIVVCNTAKVRFFKQITTHSHVVICLLLLFAIQQKYDFSSKSQPSRYNSTLTDSCLQYSKSTIFQANHNKLQFHSSRWLLFAIQQKYDFSSKSQLATLVYLKCWGCLQYSKSTIFQANHNGVTFILSPEIVVCNTAKVRFFKQITTVKWRIAHIGRLFAIQQKYDFSSKSQQGRDGQVYYLVVCNTAKVRFFKQITTDHLNSSAALMLFAIQQKYDFSSKSQPLVG